MLVDSKTKKALGWAMRGTWPKRVDDLFLKSKSLPYAKRAVAEAGLGLKACLLVCELS